MNERQIAERYLTIATPEGLCQHLPSVSRSAALLLEVMP